MLRTVARNECPTICRHKSHGRRESFQLTDTYQSSEPWTRYSGPSLRFIEKTMKTSGTQDGWLLEAKDVWSQPPKACQVSHTCGAASRLPCHAPCESFSLRIYSRRTPRSRSARIHLQQCLKRPNQVERWHQHTSSSTRSLQ